MLTTSFQKKLFLITIPVFLFLSLPLTGATRKPTKPPIDKGEGYCFTTSYSLHTASEPNDLKVDMISEFNMKKESICSTFPWMGSTNLRFLDLNFEIDGEPLKITMHPQDNRVRVGGLEEVKTSVWYYALKNLTESIAKQCYGMPISFWKNFSESPANPTLGSVDIKVENHKLRYIYDRTTPDKKKYQYADIQIQEEMYLGKNRIIAKVNFSKKKIQERPDSFRAKKYITLIHTKHGLKEGTRSNTLSKATRATKKLVQKSIDRYLKFKNRYSNVTRSAPIIFVDRTLKKEKRPYRIVLPL
jgi:hypothetical protein